MRKRGHMKKWKRNDRNKHRKPGLWSAVSILSVLLICTVFLPPPVSAAEESEKTVRVGYVNALNYEEGGEGEYKRGAGYEYLQKLSYLTGWNYEYVYGSFTECSDMLAKGEIDLFGNVSYTPERAELYDFSSYPQGKDTYWLYVKKDRSDLTGGDPHKLEGCRIGVTEGSYQEGLLTEWLQDNDISAELVPYNGYDEMMPAIDAGEVEAIAAPDLATSYDYQALVSIGFSDYYFAVAKGREDLLSELNSALYEIQNTESDYNSKLSSRYYYKTASGMPFNDEEKEWLASHDNTLRLGYRSDNLPFSGEENGELNGILHTVVETLEEEYGIQIQTSSYTSLKEMEQALQSNEVDVIGPVISDYYLTEQNGFVLTDSIIDTTPVVIYKKDYQNSLQKIAVTDRTLFGTDIAGVLFPDAELQEYDTLEDCLKAVTEGKAGSTLISSSRINILNANPLMEGLSFAEVAKQNEVGLLATKENRRAATIFNKGIEQSSDLLSGVVLAQHSVVDESVTLAELIKENALLFIGLSIAIIVILGTLLYRLAVSRKQVVAALEEAKSANSANDAKTTFLNNMSHDIRTPMNAIIGYTDIALKNHPTAEIRSCLENVRKSSDYLLSLLNDVLDISRIESGNIPYNPVPMDITAVTDSVLEIVHGFLVNRNLNLVVHRDEPATRYVLADEVRIREILINILSNAVKFTHDGGQITFETFRLPGEDEQHMVYGCRITDTGIGISEEFIGHIFEEFSQEQSDARTQYKGTGLGMAITKQYVDLMEGTITVESVKGQGTSFTVMLPLELSDSIEKEETVPSEPKNLTGMRVTRAVDGMEAVKMFQSHPAGTFDVILMDIMMPRMNGYEATRAIRQMAERPDGAGIPIIAMTANAFAEDVQKCMDAGMNAHLAKPIVIDTVTKTIADNMK